MCLYAMNEMFALVNFEDASKKDKKPNYYSAFNDLLKINATLKGLVKFYDYIIKWIKKYGCNIFFTKQSEELAGDDEEFYAACADMYSYIYFGETKQTTQEAIKKIIKSKKISYIDSDFKPESGSYAFNLVEFRNNVRTLRTVLELYSFVNGEPMIVPQVAQNGKPLLSSELITSCSEFYPLSKFHSNMENSFILEPHYKEEVNTPTSDLYRFEVFDSNKAYEVFTLSCDNHDSKSKEEFLQRWRETILTPSMIQGYPLHKTDKYGDVYFQLAQEIICAYLDMYCSIDTYHSHVYSLYEFNETTGRFKKKSPSTINAEKEGQLWGYIELHSALAQSILKSRVLKCEYCNHYFISRRNDAKTCGEYCRNRLNKDRKECQEQKEQRQPHAEG